MRRWVTIGVLAFAWASFGRAAARAQATPGIELDPAIECWFHSEFPTLTALLSPPEDIVQSRLYFRCSTYPDYYFVDLGRGLDGSFTAVAPRAEPSCPSVHYYVEALGRDFTSSRTEERVAEVTDTGACRRRYPSAAWFPGDDPNIVLGSTVSGPAFAPGFSEAGVTGFISSSGAVSSVAAAGGGGLGAGAIAGLAAGGAAAGVGVLAAGGGSGSGSGSGSDPVGNVTTTTVPVVSPPPPSPPPAPAPTLKACFTLDPPDGQIETNESLTIDGRCSEGGPGLHFRYDLGDGRFKEGQAFVTAIWTQPGTYNLTLIVSRPDPFALGQGAALEEDRFSREITVSRPEPEPVPEPPSPVVAAFTTHNVTVDVCHVQFDASASTGDIVSYEWELDTINAFGQGVIRASGRIVEHDWDNDCVRAQGVSFAKLTVTGRGGQTDVLEKQFDAFMPFREVTQPDSSTTRIDTSFVAELLDRREASLLIRLPDGTSHELRAGTRSLSLHATAGPGALDMTVSGGSSAAGPFALRLDFRATHGFVPASLRVVSGLAVSQDAYSVVLRFDGVPGERARVALRLRPPP